MRASPNAVGGVFPPGMVRLCPLFGGFNVFSIPLKYRYRSVPWFGVSVSSIPGTRFFSGDGPFVSPVWGFHHSCRRSSHRMARLYPLFVHVSSRCFSYGDESFVFPGLGFP